MEHGVDTLKSRSLVPSLLERDARGEWSLIASRCSECRETIFGNAVQWCQHCGSADVVEVLLGRLGNLWSYTVVRHPPPGQHHLPQPFVPFAIGLVEMDGEGLRVLSPLNVALDHLRVGLELELEAHPLYKDSSNLDVMSFRFRESGHGS
jgi:uncharacterized protein